jgi:hypothetical protein
MWEAAFRDCGAVVCTPQSAQRLCINHTEAMYALRPHIHRGGCDDERPLSWFLLGSSGLIPLHGSVWLPPHVPPLENEGEGPVL